MLLNKFLRMSCLFYGVMSFSQDFQKKTDSIHDDLDEVIVTATRTKRQLSSLPMPVTLISKKQILQTGATRLRDIILEQTGLVMVSDFGNSEGVQMQGVDADYTLILVNGLPLIGRTSGNIDLNRLTINNIKQIEIVKGPSSSLYGSEALGGVINIITEEPEDGSTNGSVSYMSRIEARDELDLNANVTYGNKKLGIDAGLNLNSGGAYDLSPGDNLYTAQAYQNGTGNLRLTYKFNDKLNTTIDGRYFAEKIFNDNNDANRFDYGVSLRTLHKINDSFTISYLLYGTRFKTESIFNGESSSFDQTLYRPEVKTEFNLDKGTLIAGVGGNFDALDRTFFEGKEQFNAYYVFGQYDTKIGDKINVIAGLRFDAFNKFESAFSPKLSANYKINDWITTRASIGFGYKVPDFRQLFFNFRNTAGGYIVLGTQVLHELYGDRPEVALLDKKLKPESSIGYNLGFQLKPISGLKLEINLFRNDIKDLINTFVVSRNFPDLPNTSVFSYENRDRVFTQGVELDITYKINNNIRFSAGYQYLDSGDKEEIDRINNGEVFFRRTPTSPSEKLTLSDYFGLVNRSRHVANAKLFYENFNHNLSANIRVLYRSKYALFDTNNSGDVIDVFDDFIASNALVSVAVQKYFFNTMSLQLGVDNLFDSTGTENLDNFQNLDAALRLGRTFYTRIQFNI
ncbi:outer membrane receptor protein [Tenacibaculum sp. SZ-18]|uniref:TonB-dependent receptor plug domain-containing protein n=1 Tax=Tenacibaculum sp. SZ-18 TaxID=754423 RepID=UPI000C2CEA0A|nr:TonB-dependent receptor [Tenacibaculum sp. SZ-18]AUC15204.1 outer membrane receptor protein [Tenacibaculum sp. SZ-18]